MWSLIEKTDVANPAGGDPAVEMSTWLALKLVKEKR